MSHEPPPRSAAPRAPSEPDRATTTQTDSGSDQTALPIARRLARLTERASRRFPLRWHPSTEVQQLPMVGWFDPAQLVDAGLKSVVSSVIGARLDQRVVQALASRRREFFDYTFHYRTGRRGPFVDRSRPREDIWIDYVCDTGDGWNPTYAVAHAVAQPQLEVTTPDGGTVTLPRGDVLVFGGDEVYPAPSREAYHRRLIVPYEQAFGRDRPAEAPHVFAIPGNHDWYDGLTAFSRLFCSDFGGRHFAGWRTRQTRSYFALKLPGRWWLIGSDGQLQSDIDTPQIEYFRHIADRHMQAGDHVVVCLATPTWIYAHKYRQHGGHLDETDLLYLRDHVFARRGVTMHVFLSGDYHHYRRHEEVSPPDPDHPAQKITAGGGGAFLHPTHDEDVSTIEEACVDTEATRRTFALKTSYPDVPTSSRLTSGNVLFAARNPAFGIVPALVYLFTAWIVSAGLDHPQPETVQAALWLTLEAFKGHPGLTLWVTSITLALVGFTDTHSRVYKWVGGLTHAALHWLCLFALGWGALAVSRALLPYWGLGRFTLVAVLVGAGAWVLGSTIVGLYLYVSLNVFGRHSEEAFSSLRVEDYKHFLRLHVAKDGSLTIYPIGLDRVPRAWRPRQETDASPSHMVPEEPLEPSLIEPPIVVGAPGQRSPAGEDPPGSRVSTSPR